MPQSDRIIEQTKVDFSIPDILRSRELSWKVLEILKQRIHVGMTEEDADKLALSVIKELGGEKNWHRPHVRFGENTLLSFRGVSKPGVKLGRMTFTSSTSDRSSEAMKETSAIPTSPGTTPK